MPLVPALPPQPVRVFSGFDYVTVDAARRRVYAAHTGSGSLLIADADSGKVLGQVRFAHLHGLAVDPQTGHVYTGDGESRSVTEVDPVAMNVVRSVDVDGVVDAIAYDPALHRIYADEDDGTHIYVVDSKTFKTVGTVNLPGHKPEYLAVDTKTHDVYQNIATDNEYVVVDAQTLAVKKTVKTPEIQNNHPLQFDSERGLVYVAGKNGVLSIYDRSGKRAGGGTVQHDIDQCSLDAAHNRLACFGGGQVTLSENPPGASPNVVARYTAEPGVHTGAIDPSSQRIWMVWGGPAGDFIQALEHQQ
jgi:DNA-binding beta-propeller fold protein YncE